MIATHPNLSLAICVLVGVIANIGSWRYSPLKYRSGQDGKLGQFVVPDNLAVRNVRLFMLSYAVKWTAVGLGIGMLII
jgi:hypothetical protein